MNERRVLFAHLDFIDVDQSVDEFPQPEFLEIELFAQHACRAHVSTLFEALAAI